MTIYKRLLSKFRIQQLLIVVYLLLFFLLGLTVYFVARDSESATRKFGNNADTSYLKLGLLNKIQTSAVHAQVFFVQKLKSDEKDKFNTISKGLLVYRHLNDSNWAVYKSLIQDKDEQALFEKTIQYRMAMRGTTKVLLEQNKLNKDISVRHIQQVAQEIAFENYQNSITAIGDFVIARSNTKNDYLALDIRYVVGRINILILITGTIVILLGFLIWRSILKMYRTNIALEQNEEKLKESELLFRTLAEKSLVGISIIQNGKFVYVNSEYSNIWGYTEVEFIGMPTSQITYKGDQENVQEKVNDRLSGKVDALRYEARGVRKDGLIRWVEIFGAAATYKGKPALVSTIIDISERKESELERQKIISELSLLNKVNDTILAAEDERDLYESICKCIVEEGEHILAWLAHKPIETERDTTLAADAFYGDKTLLETSEFNWPKMRLNDIEIVAETFSYPHTKQIDDNLDLHPNTGTIKYITIPLNLFDAKKPALLFIYSQSANAFDAYEISILKRLANNVSLAVKGIRTRNEKEEAKYYLSERMKELATIYRFNTILQDEKLSFDSIFSQILEIIPPGWQYPEICEAKIVFDGKEYLSENYQDSQFKQIAEMQTQDNKKGYIEVIYTEEKPLEVEGPFFKEERELINALAEMFVSHYNKRMSFSDLTKSEANLSSVFNSTDVGFLLVDLNYKIISFNKSYLKGFSLIFADRLRVNANYIELLKPERREIVKSYFEKAASENTAVEYDIEFENKNEFIYFNLNIIPVNDKNQTIGFCISADNITKRKLMELEKQSVLGDLIQRNRDLEQFAYIVSHNLRAPVANIIGLNNLLQQEISEELRKQSLEYINTSVERLDTVIIDLNSILQVRREIGENKTLVDLKDLIRNIELSISQLINETKTIINTDFSAVPQILSIQSYLNSIFFNLISNSIKYADPSRSPLIQITSEIVDGKIQIIFKDNGLGIDMDKHGDKVFGLYKRFHLEKEGKGVGLYMTKTQIEVLGGKIRVNSEPGKGTTFILTFVL